MVAPPFILGPGRPCREVRRREIPHQPGEGLLLGSGLAVGLDLEESIAE